MSGQSGVSIQEAFTVDGAARSPYGAVATPEPLVPDVVERTMHALRQRNIGVRYVATKEEARTAVLDLLPPGARVATGGSTTLHQLGVIADLSRDESGYEYLNKQWLAENDPEKRNRLRASASVAADYFLGSVQAITESGEVIAADAGGSRQGPYVFGPPHVIWVAGTQKIVPTLEDGLRRLREVALPLEDQRMKSTGLPGSRIGKIVIYEWERPNRIELILVGEALGF